jgi:hypothetical protein
MDTDNPGSIATTFGNTEIEVVNVTMENGMVSKSEDNVASVSEMLQRVATKDPAILGILQQL